MSSRVLDLTKGWPRERLAERVSAAAYGTVLVLTALPLIDADKVSSGFGWELVTGVGVATWLAHLYAELVGDHVRHGTAPRRHHIIGAMLDGLPILLAALSPAVILLLGRLEILSSRAALWFAVAVAALQLVAVGVAVGATLTSGRHRLWAYAATTATLGGAVVAIKLLLGH